MAITVNGTNGFTTDNGALKLDTDTLVIDDTNNRVGIGTSSPGSSLTIASDSTYAIDVSRPTAGNTTLRITSGSTAGNDAIFRADIANTTGSSGIYFGDSTTSGIGRIMYEHNGDYMRFYTSSAEQMRIDGSGIVTKSNQPAFLARFTGGSDQTLIDGSAVDLEFSEEIYDTGSDYNTSTYTFTAPVTGKYLLTFGVRVDVIQDDASYYRPQIHTSNRPYYDIFDSAGFSADTSYQSFTMSVIADMDASDVAKAMLRQQGGTAVSHVDASNGYSWFSGYLLG